MFIKTVLNYVHMSVMGIRKRPSNALELEVPIRNPACGDDYSKVADTCKKNGLGEQLSSARSWCYIYITQSTLRKTVDNLTCTRT